MLLTLAADFNAMDAIRLVILIGFIITLIDVIRSDYSIPGKLLWAFLSLFVIGMLFWWFKYRDE